MPNVPSPSDAFSQQDFPDAPGVVNEQSPPRGDRGKLLVDMAGYLLLRIGLLVLIAALIWGIGRCAGVLIPPLVALLFAAVVSMPVSLLLFKNYSHRVGNALAQLDERRRTQRATLRAHLSGEYSPHAPADASHDPPIGHDKDEISPTASSSKP